MSNVIQFSPKFVSKVLAKRFDLPAAVLEDAYKSLGERKMLPQLHATLEIKEWHSFQRRK